MTKNLQIHPVAALYPSLADEEFQQLVADIKTNGQYVPIVLTADGNIIVDGINRWKACKAADVEPKFRNLPKSCDELDVINFINSANLRRRDLSTGQKTMIALGTAPHLEAAARERQAKAGGDQKSVKARKNRKSVVHVRGQGKKRAPRVVDQVAKTAGVSHGAVSKGKKVEASSPKLAGDVRAGIISLDDAYKQVRAAEKAVPDKEPKPALSKTHITLKTYDGEQVQYKLPKGAAIFNETNENVGWAMWTWNPVTGCLHECQFKYCYAKSIASAPKYKEVYPVGFKPLFHHERLSAPANSRIPDSADRSDPRWNRVFVCSMADLYGKWVPPEWIDQVHAACISNPQWEYLMLTKFPRRYVGLTLPPTAWIGTTVDEQKRVRIAEEAFREIGNVRLKWLSLEPLLTPLEFSDLSMFDFVVIGSQSAADLPEVGRVPEFAPPFEWVARLTAQAHEAGCKVYQKPNLMGRTDAQHAGMKLIQEAPDLPPLPRSQGVLSLVEAAE